MNKLRMLVAASVFAAVALPATNALAVDEHFIDAKAVVDGYDVVAYHTVGKPTKGSAKYSTSYQGATWHFASKNHLELFKAEPAKYAPAYGGWCAGGASKGKKVPTKPDLWAIVEGQLYLNSSPKVHNNLFLANTETVIRKGESNWKQIFATSREELLAQ
ncbi:MAG: YHS domain-containing (seleno)protein [Cellvibrionaceae bacterium]